MRSVMALLQSHVVPVCSTRQNERNNEQPTLDPQKRDGFARQVVANAPSPHVLAAYTALTDTGYIYASIGASDVMPEF